MRYGILMKKKILRQKRGKDFCSTLINALIPQVSTMLNKRNKSSKTFSLGMQVGYSKVFLQTTVFDVLELLRNTKLGHSAVLIQKIARRFVARRRYYICWMAALTIQCFFRQVGACRHIYTIKVCTAAIKIQSVWRRFLAETELMASRLIAHFCQAYWRGIVARKLYAIMSMEKQAELIQRCWRGHYIRFQYLTAIKSIISIQCCWRCKLARIVVKDLRRDARSIVAIVAERDRFKEESVRLRKEVQRLRLSKEKEMDSNPNEEVERLRREIKRLQTVLTQAQGSISVACSDLGDDDMRSFSSYARNSWRSNSCGNEYTGNHESPLLPRTVYSAHPSSLAHNGSNHFGAPGFSNRQFEGIALSSVHSVGFSPAMSSPSASLLDADPVHHEIVYCQLENSSESISSPSRTFLS